MTRLRNPLLPLARVHGVDLASLGVVAAAWIVAALLAHIGIPAVEQSLAPTPRPMETLGTAAVCLPACLLASLLRDQAAWLTTVSPRAPWALRTTWFVLTVAAGTPAALVWVIMLPDDVPRGHAFGLWVLLLSLAMLSVTVIGHDLAAVLPVAAVVVFSLGRLVPFDVNLVYNVGLTRDLALVGLVSFVSAAGAYALLGDGRSRRRG